MADQAKIPIGSVEETTDLSQTQLISQALKRLRKTRKMPVTQLIEESGMTPGQTRHLMAGDAFPSDTRGIARLFVLYKLPELDPRNFKAILDHRKNPPLTRHVAWTQDRWTKFLDEEGLTFDEPTQVDSQAQRVPISQEVSPPIPVSQETAKAEEVSVVEPKARTENLQANTDIPVEQAPIPTFPSNSTPPRKTLGGLIDDVLEITVDQLFDRLMPRISAAMVDFTVTAVPEGPEEIRSLRKEVQLLAQQVQQIPKDNSSPKRIPIVSLLSQLQAEFQRLSHGTIADRTEFAKHNGIAMIKLLGVIDAYTVSDPAEREKRLRQIEGVR